MPPSGPESEPEASRRGLLREGLGLSVFSIVWGLASGAWAVVSALGAHSLGVLGLGLNLAADVSGSVFVSWRLWSELHGTHEPERAERIASLVVGAVLAAVALFLAVEALLHLAHHDLPHPSGSSLAAAATSVLVLIPLGIWKRRVGVSLRSAALRGDGSLSLLGGTVAALSFAGLVLDQTLGWWWADAVAALVVAGTAVAESVRTLRGEVL